MPIKPDLIAYSRLDQPCLVVEVKNTKHASENWATQFRRNLMAHGGFPVAPYFMLVTPQVLYLWRDSFGKWDEPPAAAVSTREALGMFLEALPHGRLDELALELITHAWLSSVASSAGPHDEPGQHDAWLQQTGLLDALKGGHVELEPAA